MKQIELGEDNSFEFKEAMFSGNTLKGPLRDVIADELTAMGNAEGGTLIFSVSDAGKVLPLNREQMDALEAVILEVCNDSIKPPLLLKTQRIALPDNSPVLLVEVAQSNDVHKSGGKYWHRQGSAKREIPAEVLARLMEQRSRAGRITTDEQIVDDTNIRTLDPVLCEHLISTRAGVSAESKWRRLKLIREDQRGEMRATVSGILLCTNKPEVYLPNALIQAVRYIGTTQSTQQIDAAVITGPLGHQIKEAVAFAVRNMCVSARKEPARVDMPQYSERAIFEAIVNAVVHRDYSIRGSHIRLLMFEDRLELSSPGALNNSLTLESMGELQSTRNQTLASLMGRLPTEDVVGAGDRQYFLERRGEGVPIIREQTTHLTGREPMYRLINGSTLLLTLPAALPPTGGVQAEVSVSADGKSLGDVHVHALYPNKTWKEAKTDSFGRANFDFHSELPMTVFCAAPGYAAHVERDWNPAAPLAVELKTLANGGGIVFSENTGYLPGLKGRLNPILDTYNRSYIHTSNIAIDGGKAQPVQFTLEEPLRMKDADGNELVVRIIEIIGKSVLVEYQTPSF